MGESRKIATEIAKSLNRRIIREKILAHRVPDTLDEEVRKRNLPGDKILSIRMEADNIARKLRVAELKKRLA